MRIFRRFVCIRQNDVSDCGAACLATISLSHGLRTSVAKIRQHAGTDRHGTTVFGLAEAARMLGFQAKAARGGRDALTRIPLPAIAHTADNGLLHFVVIHQVEEEQLVIADPAMGLSTIPLEEFLRRWTGVLILLVPAPTFLTGGDTRRPWRRFIQLLKPHDFLLAECFLTSVFLMVLGLSFSIYLQLLADRVFAVKDWSLLNWLSIGLLIVVVCKAVLGELRGLLMAYVSRKIDASLILEYYRHVLRLPMQFFDSRHTGEIISRVADAVKIREALSGSTLTLLVDGATTIALLGILCLYNFSLAALVIATLPTVLLAAWALNRPMRKCQRKTMEQVANLQSHFMESFGGVGMLKATNAEESVTDRAEIFVGKVIKAFFGAGIWATSSAIVAEAIIGVAMVVVLWSAGNMVMRGEFSLGQFVAFYSMLLFMFQPMMRLVAMNQGIQNAMVAAERLCEILDLDQETESGVKKICVPAGTPGAINFRNVSFAYGGRGCVLRDLTFEIAPGSLLAITGASGSGKSSLARLLLRYYDPVSGQIELDGYNLRDLDLASLRQHIGYVDQDASIHSGSVYENLTMGYPDVPYERVIDAVKRVGLEDFVNSLPLRYQTVLGSRGLSLSGGQRQRLAIARILIRDPKVLILDEATSNLDIQSEKEVFGVIATLKLSKTLVVIAHRPSILWVADRILVLDNGRILKWGSPHEIMEKAISCEDSWSLVPGGL